MIEVENEAAMRQLGERLGKELAGGEVIELIGDVGAGKTTLVRGIAAGMGVEETVQSPSFTISRVYDAPQDRRLAHYDFYRLSDPGIMAAELSEAVGDSSNVVIIEWADTVGHILPLDRLTIVITALGETGRRLDISAEGENGKELIGKLQ